MTGFAKFVLWATGIFVVFVFAVALLVDGKGSDPNSEYSVLEAGKDAVRRQSKDPDAVKFGDVWVGQAPHGKVACGYFNGKNSFGAYSGQQRFFAGVNKDQQDVVLTDEKSRAMMDAGWQQLCGQFHRG